MSFPDIVPELEGQHARSCAGGCSPNEPLAPLTWFRVGGPAQALFMPEDEADLAYFLANLAGRIPVTVIGLGSNLIVRDGGVAGVVVRLGRGFSADRVEKATASAPAAAVPDVQGGARRAGSRASPVCRSCAAFPAPSAARCA